MLNNFVKVEIDILILKKIIIFVNVKQINLMKTMYQNFMMRKKSVLMNVMDIN